MHNTITRKNFPGLKEMREGHSQWLMEHGWSLDYRWHDHDHNACSAVPCGRWRLQGFGYYFAADGIYRLYTSHRCSRCGMMVMHSQQCDENGSGSGLINRMIVTP